MSSFRAGNFYSNNSSRRYPVDEGATGRDDDGGVMPLHVLVDCHIRFPRTAGQYLYVSALSVTTHLVTVCFMASDTPAVGVIPASSSSTGEVDPVPVAAVTILKRDLVYGRQYAVAPLLEGVGGWVVFGEGAEERYTGRFSSVTQSQILPRCGRSYTALPIPSFGKKYVDPALTGIVTLLGGQDISVTSELRTINGDETEVVVIALDSSLNQNVLQLYTGPCGGRPESGTCDRPAIERINGVTPDDDGNIEIEFRNVSTYDLESSSGGLGLELAIGMGDVCVREARLPDSEGILPNEYTDLCEEIESSISEEEAPPPDVPAACGGLVDTFATIDPGWSEIVGTWTVAIGDTHPVDDAADNNYLYASQASRRSTIIWDCVHATEIGWGVEAGIKIMPGTYRQAGIVINHNGDPADERYFLVLINKDTSRLEIRYFCNGRLSDAVAHGGPISLVTGGWYLLTVEISDSFNPSKPFRIHAELALTAGGGAIGSPIDFDTDRFVDGEGRFGLAAVYSQARFSHFILYAT